MDYLKLIKTGEVVTPQFDPERHRYVDGNGYELPSVSSIIRPITDLAYGSIDCAVLKTAQNFGTVVHGICELLDTEIESLDELDDLDPRVLPPVEAYLEWRNKTGVTFKPENVELRLACKRYAGTLDRFGYINDEPWVIDLKTCSTIHSHVGLQLAGYVALAQANIPELTGKTIRRGALQITKDGKFKLVEFSDLRDFATFSALLTINEWKSSNNY